MGYISLLSDTFGLPNMIGSFVPQTAQSSRLYPNRYPTLSNDAVFSVKINSQKCTEQNRNPTQLDLLTNFKAKLPQKKRVHFHKMQMAIYGDLRVSATLNPYKFNPLRTSSDSSKVDCHVFANRALSFSRSIHSGNTVQCNSKRPIGISGDYKLSSTPFNQEVESFLLNAINMNFFERLNLAWKILFPSPTTKRNSNANVAKQRLKMILFSDRCAVSDEAKQLIVSNVVKSLSDFVEIESQDKVQLSVSTDPDMGTIYSVTVPVRRVRTEYQIDDETGSITNIEYKDTGESSGSVDVKFDFFVPSDEFKDFSV